LKEALQWIKRTSIQWENANFGDRALNIAPPVYFIKLEDQKP